MRRSEQLFQSMRAQPEHTDAIAAELQRLQHTHGNVLWCRHEKRVTVTLRRCGGERGVQNSVIDMDVCCGPSKRCSMGVRLDDCGEPVVPLELQLHGYAEWRRVQRELALARPPSPPSAFKPLPLAWPDAELPTVLPEAWPLLPPATPQTPPSLSPALPAMSEAPLPDGANEVHGPLPAVPPSQAAPLAPGVTQCTAITSLGERCRVTSEHSVIGAPLQHGGMLCREHMRRLPSSNPRPIPSSGRAIPKPTDRCKKCKQLGHWRAHCPNAWVAGPCALCGAIGHFAYACTKPR